MAWNPVLDDEKLKGLDRVKRPSAPPGEIVVLLGRGGASDVLVPGSTPTAGEMRTKSYQRAIRLTANPHTLSHEFQLPSSDVGVLFNVEVSMDVRVNPISATAAAQTFAVESGSADDLVGQRVRAIAAPICSRYAGISSQDAQNEVLGSLRESLDLTEWGFIASDIAVHLRLPADLEKEIGRRHVDEHSRQNELAGLEHNQTVSKKRNEHARNENLLDTDAEIEEQRRQLEAEDLRERQEHSRRMDLRDDEHAANIEMTRARRLAEIDISRAERMAEIELGGAEHTASLQRKIEALHAARELGPLSEAELNRLYILENPDAPSLILEAKTNRLNNDDARKFNVLTQMIERGEIDLRREEDREAFERLLPTTAETEVASPEIGGGEVEVEPPPTVTVDDEAVDADIVEDTTAE